MARSITFTIDFDVPTQITITETENGMLAFAVDVLDTGLIGDLRALFFDLNGLTSNAALGISAGADVTDHDFAEAGVDSLERDANIRGSVVNELGDFDVGMEFGTSGRATDDIQSTSFARAHDTIALSFDMIELADFGARYTSAGEDGGARKASVKASVKAEAQAAGVARNEALTVLENEAVSLDLLSNDTGSGQVTVTVTVTGVADGDGGLAAVAGGFERALVLDGLALRVLSVVGVNDAPTMTDGVLDTTEDGAAVMLDLSALGADIDSDDDGATLSYGPVGVASEGSAAVTGTTLTFDPGDAVQDLA